jgi:hypothetical protein
MEQLWKCELAVETEALRRKLAPIPLCSTQIPQQSELGVDLGFPQREAGASFQVMGIYKHFHKIVKINTGKQFHRYSAVYLKKYLPEISNRMYIQKMESYPCNRPWRPIGL